MSKSEPPFDPVQVSPEFKADLLKEGRTALVIKKLTKATGCSMFVAKQWLTEIHEKERTPCPYCGISLPSAKARQCFSCGMDWHDPNDLVRRSDPERNRLGLKNRSLYVVELCQDAEGGRYTKYREINAEPSDPNMVFETESAHGSQLAEWGYKYSRYLRLSNGERFGFEDGRTWMTETEIEFMRRKVRGLAVEGEALPWVNGIPPRLEKA